LDINVKLGDEAENSERSKTQERRGREGKEKGREGENDLMHPLSQIPGHATGLEADFVHAYCRALA